LGDLVAGATNALVYLPQGIGYAIVAGVNPVYGLYTGIFAPALAAFTVSSVFMEVTATNEMAIPAGRIAYEMGVAFTPQKLFAMTLLVGVFASLAGLLRLGRVVHYISSSVMTGFVLGIMVMLILGQMRHLTGFSGPTSGNDLVRTFQILKHPDQMDVPTLLAGIATMLVIAILLNTRLRHFAYAFALAGGSLVVNAYGASSIVLTGARHAIHSGMPRLVLPDLRAIPELLMPSLSLAILGLSFGAGVAQAYPAPDGAIGDSSRDFFGQGIANLVSSLFQCIPSSGSMSRTTYLVESGAKTRWAHVFTGITSLAVVLTAAHLAERIPLTVVAGVLMVIGYTAIDGKQLRLIWQINRVERYLMLLTAVLTVALSPPLAILIGAALSFLGFIEASANSIGLAYLVPGEDEQFVVRAMPERFLPDAVTVLRVHGYLFFAGIGLIEGQLESLVRTRNAALVLSFLGYDSVGSNGLIFLERFSRRMAAAGNSLLLADVSSAIQAELSRTGILDELGAQSIFPATADLHESLARAYQAALARISARTEVSP
jgi:sulfate permease, SulP family